MSDIIQGGFDPLDKSNPGYQSAIIDDGRISTGAPILLPKNPMPLGEIPSSHVGGMLMLPPERLGMNTSTAPVGLIPVPKGILPKGAVVPCLKIGSRAIPLLHVDVWYRRPDGVLIFIPEDYPLEYIQVEYDLWFDSDRGGGSVSGVLTCQAADLSGFSFVDKEERIYRADDGEEILLPVGYVSLSQDGNGYSGDHKCIFSAHVYSPEQFRVVNYGIRISPAYDGGSGGIVFLLPSRMSEYSNLTDPDYPETPMWERVTVTFK